MKYRITAIVWCVVMCGVLPAMERELSMHSPGVVSDSALQKFIEHTNKSSLSIVELLKKSIQLQNSEVKANYLPFLTTRLDLDQSTIDNIFFDTIDDEMRPLMLGMGANVKAIIDGENCLFKARSPQALKELISQDADVNCRDKDGKSVFHHHCYWGLGDKKMVAEKTQVLIEAGADISPSKDQVFSFLRKAIDEKNEGLIQLLCKHPHVDIHEKNSLGQSFFWETIEQELVEGVSALLKAGLSADSPDKYEEYPLHVALPQKKRSRFTCIPFEKERKPLLTIIVSLLQHKADPNRPYPCTNGKLFPLHAATTWNNFEIITALLQHGAFVDKHVMELAREWECSQNILELLSQAKLEILVVPMAEEFQEDSSDALEEGIAAAETFAEALNQQLQSPAAFVTQNPLYSTPAHRVCSIQ
jgi:ankyrin repeat protein